MQSCSKERINLDLDLFTQYILAPPQQLAAQDYSQTIEFHRKDHSFFAIA